MATTQLPCAIHLKLVTPDNRTLQDVVLDSTVAGQGGASGATPANTLEKWYYLNESIVVASGCSLVIEVVSRSTQTLNTTDSFINLPLNIYTNGGKQQVFLAGMAATTGDPNFTVDQAISALSAASAIPTTVYKATAKQGRNFSIGGGKVFISFQY